MTAQTTTSLVLVATPVLAALLGLLLWGKPEGLKDWLLIATGLSLGTLAWRAETLPMQSGGLFLLSLLPLMAFITLLGQPLHASHAAPSVLTLLLAGLGLGVLASEGPVSLIFFFFLLAAVGVILFYYRHRTSSDTWWGIGTLSLGLFGVGVALTAVPPVSSIALVIACATGLPLVPFHKGYVAALKGLPGNLPAFVALLLPVIGFHSLTAALAQLPSTVTEVAGILALMGMLYGSLKALNQSRAALVVAYGSVAFLSILWWCLVTAQAVAPQTVVYLSAVSLATGGLLLAWYMLEARYGEIGLGALSGLARPMPRFAMAVSLLALAALGLPPFGVFSGFMGLLLAPLVKWSGGLIIMLVAWLSASWYLFDLVQRLLWGCQSTDRRHEDLRDSELASLAIVLLLLVALGVMPSRLFNLGPRNLEPTVVMEFLAWKE